MKRFFLLAAMLLSVIGHGRAATVTGTMIDLTGSPDDGTVVLTPVDSPRNTSQGMVRHHPVSVVSVDGVFTFPTVVQGKYSVSVDGEAIRPICVPAGNGTFYMHLGQLDCGTGVGFYLSNSDAYKVYTSTNDATPGVLAEKITAGTNVVITTQTDQTGAQAIQINSIALSGATFDTNTLTLTFTGAGGFGGSGGSASSVPWGGITGTLGAQSDLATALAAKEAQSANLDLWSALAPAAKQDASTQLTNWSMINPTSKQNASVNLTNWSNLATSAKQDADADLTSLASGLVGIVKGAGNGSGYGVAVQGTDYAPATSGSAVLKGNGAGGFSAAVTGTDFAPPTSGSSLLKGNGSGGFANATSGTDYAPATSGTAIQSGNGSGGFSGVTVGSGLNFIGGTLSATGGGGSGNAILTNAAASKVAITTSDTNITTSATTATELGYLSGVTSAVQTQLNSKQAEDSDLDALAGGITGLVKGAGNGSGYSAAVAGTDYIAPGELSSRAFTIATNIVLLGRTSGAGGPVEYIIIGNGLALSGDVLSLVTNLIQINAGTLIITNAVSAGSMVTTNGFTNLTGSAGSLIKYGSDKSLQNAAAGTDYQTPIGTNTTLNCFNVVAYYDGFFNKNAAGTKSVADGVLQFLNWSENDFTRACWGPPVATNASIKKVGTTLQARLGDDSAFSPFQADYFMASDGYFGPNTGGIKSWYDGYLTLYNFMETGFSELQLGATNSAPAMRPNSTGFNDVVAGTSGATPTFRLGKSLVTAKTANYTLAASDSRTVYDNAGAAGEVDFTLPTWVSGLVYTFTITDAQTLKIIAPGTDTIRIAGSASAAGGNITASTIGNSVTLIATKSGQWISAGHEGTWTVN